MLPGSWKPTLPSPFRKLRCHSSHHAPAPELDTKNWHDIIDIILVFRYVAANSSGVRRCKNLEVMLSIISTKSFFQLIKMFTVSSVGSASCTPNQTKSPTNSNQAKPTHTITRQRRSNEVRPAAGPTKWQHSRKTIRTCCSFNFRCVRRCFFFAGMSTLSFWMLALGWDARKSMNVSK